METSISFRVKGPDGKWGMLELSEFVGRTVEDILLSFDGQDAVSEVQVSREGQGVIWTGYLCGTEKWREHYRKKGFTAKTFEEGVEALRQKGSPLLGLIQPEVLPVIDEVFPGAEIEQQVALF